METLNRLPWAAQSSVFQRLAEIGEVSALTKEERVEYDQALKKYRDTLNALAGAEQKGREEEKTKTAIRMIEKGYAIKEIAEITGLPLDELNAL